MLRMAGRGPHPLTGQSRTDSARCGAALTGHLSNIWRGGSSARTGDWIPAKAGMTGVWAGMTGH